MNAPSFADGGENGLGPHLPKILASPQDFKNLRSRIRSIDGDKVGGVAVLGFRALQLYRIARLQARLIEVQNAVMEDGTEECPNVGTPEEEKADELIQRYADAIRNYEVLSQAITSNKGAKYEFLEIGRASCRERVSR